MIRRSPSEPPGASKFAFWIAAVCAGVVSIALTVQAYVLSGGSWPAGSQVVMQLGLGNAGAPLLDGNTSWDDAVLPAPVLWNQQMLRMQFSTALSPGSAAASGDHVNSVVFSPTVFGEPYGDYVLATTVTMLQGSTLTEADVLFNPAAGFDSYRGELRLASNGAGPLPDIRRVFLHELGHCLGLAHAGPDAIMNPYISDLERLAPDDIAGVNALYGAPPPVIISPLSALVTVNQRFIYQFVASGATSLSVSNLPQGLMFDPMLKAIVGTPTATGTFSVGLSATNSVGTTMATLTLTVQPTPASGPVMISGTSATGRTGRRFTFQVITSGATAEARVSATGLPNGLTLDALSGEIIGTVRVDGSFGVTLTVTDGPATTSATLQLTFSSDPFLPVIISSNEQGATVGQPFDYQIDAPSAAGADDPTVFSVIGLPAGLVLNASTGHISGTLNGIAGHEAGGKGGGIDLSGGVIVSMDLFAGNSNGVTHIPLNLFDRTPRVVNISTRLAIGTGSDVLIGGFIIRGDAPKKLVIRAIGPSLPVPGALQDPTLQLFQGPTLLQTIDNWRDFQEQEIIDSTLQPTDDREAAMVAYLSQGAYTAIVSGKDGQTGIGLVEVYDLGTASPDIARSAALLNISTRGRVQSGDDVMIGGFIVRDGPLNIIVRAIGPELTGLGVAGALEDTTLELYDSSGMQIASNDDWRDSQRQQIIDSTVPPTDDRESAIVANLPPGGYTAIVRGKNGATGVGLVEVYVLE